MARIEDSLVQAEIEDSLLGEPQELAPEAEREPSYWEGDAVDLLNQEIHDRRYDPIKFGDAATEPEPTNQERLADLSTDRTDRRESEQEAPREEWREAAERRALSAEEVKELQAQQETRQDEWRELTAEEARQGIQALDDEIQKHGLNDLVSAKEFALGLAGTFGGDLGSYNVEQLGSVMSKVALSADRILDHLQQSGGQMPPVPAESAKQFASDLIRACGGDPRIQPVDAQLLADVVFRGALNFLNTARSRPGETDVARLNDPEAAEWLLANFYRAFGVQQPVDRQTALKFADAAGKYLLSALGKYAQLPARQPQPRGSRRSARVPGGRIRGMQSNIDLYDQATLNAWRNEHGRL